VRRLPVHCAAVVSLVVLPACAAQTEPAADASPDAAPSVQPDGLRLSDVRGSLGAPRDPQVIVSTTAIELEGRRLAPVERGYIAPDSVSNHLVGALHDALIESAGPPTDRGDAWIRITADRRVTYAALVDVMYTTGRAGWSQFALSVGHPDSGAARLVAPPRFSVGDAALAPKPAPVRLELYVAADAISVLAPAVSKEIVALPVSRPEASLDDLDRWDWQGLMSLARAEHDELPESKTLIVSADPDVPVGAVMQALDTTLGPTCDLAAPIQADQPDPCWFRHIIVESGAGSAKDSLQSGSEHPPVDKDVVRTIVRAHLDEVRGCYNEGLGRDPKLAGRVAVTFVIGPDGHVASAQIEEGIGDDGVERCLVERVKTWKFPAPVGGGNVIISYPFNFRPD
jgi:TonB family protein